MGQIVFVLLILLSTVGRSIEKDHLSYSSLSEALRFIDNAQNSLCPEQHKNNRDVNANSNNVEVKASENVSSVSNEVKYAVVSIGIGGGFSAQVK